MASILRTGLNFNFVSAAKQTDYIDPIISFSRASTATRINPSTGLVETVAAGTPRLCGLQTLINAADGSTKTIQPGLLIEGQATNLVPNSRINSGWTLSNTTKTENYSAAPNGLNEATRLQIAVSGYALSPGLTATNTPVLSLWIKSTNGSNQTIYLADGQTYGPPITVGANWQRVYRASAGTNVNAFNIATQETPADVMVWGAQFEPGSFPSSLIPTSGATATRAADIATIDVSKIWNANAGTIICEADFGLASTLAQVAFDYWPTGGGELEPYLDTTREVKLYTSVGTLSTGIAAPHTRMVCAIKSGVIKFGRDGTINSDTVNASFSGGTLTIGANHTGANPLNGTLQQLIYMPYSLDDYVLKAASALS